VSTNLDGAEERVVFNPSHPFTDWEYSISDPTYSPLGTELYFVCGESYQGGGGINLTASQRERTRPRSLRRLARRDRRDWTKAPPFRGNAMLQQTAESRSRPVGLRSGSSAAASSSASASSVTSAAPCDENIARVSDDGTGWQIVTDWPGSEGQPALSPSGTRLAFASTAEENGTEFRFTYYDEVADQTVEAGGSQLYVANADGSSPELLTDPTEFALAYYPSFSPDGQKVAFSGLRLDDPVFSKVVRAFYNETDYFDYVHLFSRVYVLDLASGEVEVVSSTTEGKVSQQPTWSPDGTKLIYTEMEVPDQHNTAVATPSWLTRVDVAVPSHSETMILNGPVSIYDWFWSPKYQMTSNGPLFRFAPVLRYDNEEAFRADSPRNIIDFPGNTLARENGDDVNGGLDLSIDFLDTVYGDGEPATNTDQIDAAGGDDDHAAVAQAMHTNPNYANRTYARQVQDGTGRTWLQYWLWYYHNPSPPGALGLGSHEGDWEMVQLRLNTAGTHPDIVAYANHEGGIRCAWSRVEKKLGTERPIVYVAVNSHASYIEPGVYPHLPSRAFDVADGDGDEVFPRIVRVGEDLGWIRWPGHWGGTEPPAHAELLPGAVRGIYARSPRGPLHQGAKWSDPGTWAAGVDSCLDPDIQPEESRAKRAALTPTISARWRGRTITVSYRAPQGVGAESLMVTADHPSEQRTPTLHSVRVNGPSDSVRIKAPAGIRRAIVRASVYDRLGLKSLEAKVAVKRRR
jgi:hypothetical protein